MKLDLDDYDVVELTATQARNLIDLELPDDLTDALDEAQGPVFGGQQESCYIVIKIVKDPK